MDLFVVKITCVIHERQMSTGEQVPREVGGTIGASGMSLTWTLGIEFESSGTTVCALYYLNHLSSPSIPLHECLT